MYYALRQRVAQLDHVGSDDERGCLAFGIGAGVWLFDTHNFGFGLLHAILAPLLIRAAKYSGPIASFLRAFREDYSSNSFR